MFSIESLNSAARRLIDFFLIKCTGGYCSVIIRVMFCWQRISNVSQFVVVVT